MPMDEIVKEFFDYEHFVKLFEFFKDNTEDICSCCKNELKCEGKNCPMYENLGNTLYDKETRELQFTIEILIVWILILGIANFMQIQNVMDVFIPMILAGLSGMVRFQMKQRGILNEHFN